MNRSILVPFLTLLASAALGWFVADRWYARQWEGERREAMALRNRYAARASNEQPTTVADERSLIRFEDAAGRLEMNFVYDDGATGDFQIFETIGGGMAVADFDRDGRLDVFFPNGCRLPIDAASNASRPAFYLRNGAVKEDERVFADVAEPAGLALHAYLQGASAADFNHDGFDDLLVTGYHALKLFRNQGDGSFVPVPLANTADAYQEKWWTSAAWFDADGDGNLDVYICAYATVDAAHPKDCRRGAVRMHCHPSTYVAEPDLLLRNQGDGRFRDATAEFGFTETLGRGLGVAVADFLDSGAASIYVANDTTEAYLWVREPGRRPSYVDRSASLGVGLTGSGVTMAGMGVAVGDFDRNGFPDLFVTDFFEAGGNLFASVGSQGFVPKSSALGLLAPTRRRLGFGTVFIDANLDGWPDLVAVNGHVSDLTALGIPYKMKAQVFRNDQGRRFADVSNASGEYFRRPLLGRGLASGDFNNDGRPDLVVSNIRDPAAMLLNVTQDHGQWIGFEFVGRTSARDARNVKVEITRRGKTDRYEQHSGGGFLSSSDPRLLIGLGKNAAPVDRVLIRWPSGRSTSLSRPALSRYHLVVESLDENL